MTPEKLREAAISVRNGAAHIRAEKCSESVEPLRELLAQHNELAADACLTLAAQMESATQGFGEVYGERPHDSQGFECWDAAHAAWHAATAQMQAKLDAANDEKDKWKNEAERLQLLHDIYERDMKLAKEHWQWPVDLTKHPLEQNLTSLIIWIEGIAQDRANERDALQERLATAERERELLRKEVRRCWDDEEQRMRNILTFSPAGSLPTEQVETNLEIFRNSRSPEVRALVEETTNQQK